MRFIAWVFAALTLIGSAASADPRYLDDRSNPESLIRSLYNAISRHEYARAWDYFETAPAKDFDTYVKGFEDTDQVQVVFGDAGVEGAAGSTFYEVPVVISAKDKKGQEKTFAGCYTLRQVNGSTQDPPNSPLRITKAALKPAKTYAPEVVLPDKCGEAPQPEFADMLQDNVIDMFLSDAKHDSFCSTGPQVEAGTLKPEVHEFKYKTAGSSDNDPPSVATLFVFPCGSGAYNTVEFYYLNIDKMGPERVTFAEPNYDYKYADDESAKLTSMKFVGFTSTGSLINSEFDQKTNSIASYSKWRGIGDAASNGTWVFVDGAFLLKDYDVDPTYDEEMNPVSVMKDGQLLPQKTP